MGKNEGGPDNLGATFYDPVEILQGFSSLGSLAQPNNIPFSGNILIGKEVSNDSSNPTLILPMYYTLVWTIGSLDIKKYGDAYIWLPNAPDGDSVVGYVIGNSTVKPPLNKVHRVYKYLTDTINIIDLGTDSVLYLDGLDVCGSMDRFVVRNVSMASLKGNLSKSMPNLNQIKALIQAYSSVIYFILMKLTSLLKLTNFSKAMLWFTDEGMNLPRDGSSQDSIKKRSLQDASSYFHVKPVSGGVFTDIVIWIFYPFNGGASAKLEFINLSLGKLGEHVGDSEHSTLRGVFCCSSGVDIEVRDDTTKSDKMTDTRVRVVVIAAGVYGVGSG
ncbi:hypothetical protein L2E82_16095 [Cichorium intybus]|uniref:Uncharacterized protein n=1 Tax=Cichorium intybus TaxID=13427 RepID=A0ACB9F5W0_CICIN|nr:hypothetical protein L2E82_16095 [Cichorium intybus]